jgi:hypothetical protein
MASELNLLHKYASIFRKMVNAKVRGKGSIKELLKLNRDTDWDFLTAAMDIVDDASVAIANVKRFGLSGPTKYDDLGEKYLRLYGLLSATYIQQQAILTIYEIMRVPNVKKMKASFDALHLRTFRHKISAHGTDYLNRTTGSKEAYVPLQIELGDKNVTAVKHASSISMHERLNIPEAIDSHITMMIDVMDTISEKAIKTLFKGQEKRRKEFEDELSELRVEKAGGMVIKGPQGAPRIIVTFV